MKKAILSTIIFTIFLLPAYSQDFYNVKYISNYDGDTIKFDLDPNLPEIFRFVPLRLCGIDTPEIKSNTIKALTARDFVKNELTSAKQINLIDCKNDKYFRINCKVVYDGKDLTKELLDKELGYPYYGGTKRK